MDLFCFSQYGELIFPLPHIVHSLSFSHGFVIPHFHIKGFHLRSPFCSISSFVCFCNSSILFLIAVALLYISSFHSTNSPLSVFFFKVDLAICGSLFFYIHLKISIGSVKNTYLPNLDWHSVEFMHDLEGN